MTVADILRHLILILLALGGSAYFSAAEMALISANPLRVRQRAKAGVSSAQRVRRLLERREHILIMFLIGQAGLNVLSAAITTDLVDRWLGHGLAAPIISIVCVTLVVVVVAEIVPKVIGKREGDRLLMQQVRVLEFLHYLFLPLTQSVHLYVKFLLRLVGRGRSSPFVTREELKLLVREAQIEDESAHREKRMLESILEFRETVAREIMIPMNQVIALEKGTTCEVWRAMVRRHGYTRIPIYKKQIDHVIGVVNVFDLLYDADPKDSVDDYVREIPIVPDSKRIDHLLVELQKTRNPMAVVVDEFGSCGGVVTVEDIVEEIVGEMADEHERSFRKIRRLAPGVFIVEGLTDIDDLNQQLGLQLPQGRYDTVGGLVLSRAGRIPREGERFGLQNVTFEVLDADAYAVRVVKVTLPKEDQSR
ncbi:MAG: HlyC/CorC family transporter [Candidatus Eisenbacteria sp.]|nr:HlyC/CorC family transporter [Candidatus Eisenbacteria bacterium]